MSSTVYSSPELTVTSLSSVLSADSAKVLVDEPASTNKEILFDSGKFNEIKLSDDEVEPNTMQPSEDWPRRQIIKLFLIGIALSLTTNLPSAFTHTSINTAIDSVNHYLNTSYIARGQKMREQDFVWLRSVLGASWYMGQIFGAQFTPLVTDKFGRKPAYLLSTAIMTAACFLQSLSTLTPYPELLILGRIMASIFSPMSDAACILYLQEVSPTHIRGVLSSLFNTSYSLMGLMGMILGTQNVLGYSITLLLSVPVIPGIFSLLLLINLPETPKFLKIVRHKDKRARRALHFYQGCRADNEKTLEAYAQEGDENEGSILDIFRKKYLRRALVCTVMCTIPSLVFYPILQGSTHLLKKLSFEGSVPEHASTVMMLVLIVCGVIAAEFLNRFKRRRLFVACSTAATISIALFSVSGALISIEPRFKYLSLLGLFGYIVSHGLGLGPISFFIGTELVPIQYRSSMFSISFSLNNILIFVTSICVQPAYDTFGSLFFLVLFVFPSVVAIMYVNANLPETKGRETHQIVEALRRRTGFFKRNNIKKGVTNPSFKGKDFIVTPVQLV